MQYVEGLNGETARRSRVFALAVEALMNNAGWVAISLACICLQGGGHGLHRGERYHEPYAVTLVRGVDAPSSFTPFPYRIVAFSLSFLVSWL